MKINANDVKRFCDAMNESIIPGDNARVDFECFYRPYNQFPVYVSKDDFKVIHAIEGLLSLITWENDRFWERQHDVSVIINGRHLRTVNYWGARDPDSYVVDMDTGVVYVEITDDEIYPVSDEEFLNEPFTW